jgi:uncharacterized SAM-binding protein YcdF (DUF218 family)
VKRYLVFFGILLLLLALGFLFRKQLLQGLGNYLVKEDPLIEAEALFVLAGEAYERTQEAEVLFRKGKAPIIYTLGAENNPDLRSLGTQMPEAELMREALLKAGLPDSAVHTLPMGSSTFEESEAILGFASAREYKTIIVVSSKLHTRRVRNVFRRKFARAGIEVVVRGADPEGYKLDEWWRYEKGLIFVNNEYVKLFYYALRY